MLNLANKSYAETGCQIGKGEAKRRKSPRRKLAPKKAISTDVSQRKNFMSATVIRSKPLFQKTDIGRKAFKSEGENNGTGIKLGRRKSVHKTKKLQKGGQKPNISNKPATADSQKTATNLSTQFNLISKSPRIYKPFSLRPKTVTKKKEIDTRPILRLNAMEFDLNPTASAPKTKPKQKRSRPSLGVLKKDLLKKPTSTKPLIAFQKSAALKKDSAAIRRFQGLDPAIKIKINEKNKILTDAAKTVVDFMKKSASKTVKSRDVQATLPQYPRRSVTSTGLERKPIKHRKLSKPKKEAEQTVMSKITPELPEAKNKNITKVVMRPIKNIVTIPNVSTTVVPAMQLTEQAELKTKLKKRRTSGTKRLGKKKKLQTVDDNVQQSAKEVSSAVAEKPKTKKKKKKRQSDGADKTRKSPTGEVNALKSIKVSETPKKKKKKLRESGGADNVMKTGVGYVVNMAKKFERLKRNKLKARTTATANGLIQKLLRTKRKKRSEAAKTNDLQGKPNQLNVKNGYHCLQTCNYPLMSNTSVDSEIFQSKENSASGVRFQRNFQQ